MLFNSFTFAVFFALLVPAYFALRRRLDLQNYLLLGASYLFYGWWDWRFLGLIVGSTLVDFIAARAIEDGPKSARKRWLMLSVVVNLGALGVFKYFDFFAQSLADLVAAFGVELDPFLLSVTLPVGISFYTFQTLSYTIDVYRGDAKPCRRLDRFALYVSFFPQLVAGPIERAPRLLQQISTPRKISAGQVEVGVWLMLWGLFKKMVIADHLSPIADRAFGMHASPGLDVLLGALAFTFQIYCDFSGYTDIARGIAKILGFDLTLNFRIPYLALSPSDFWRRWHISLSSWLRDYLYIPLGGNRGGKANMYRNLMITMLLGGLWHGAAWNFVIWGLYHGLLLIAFRPYEKRLRGRVWLALPLMFTLTVLGWIIFRSPNIESMVWMISHLGVAPSGSSMVNVRLMGLTVAPLILIWFFQARSGDLAVVQRLPRWLRIPLYGACAALILVYGVRGETEFIYFQF